MKLKGITALIILIASLFGYQISEEEAGQLIEAGYALFGAGVVLYYSIINIFKTEKPDGKPNN